MSFHQKIIVYEKFSSLVIEMGKIMLIINAGGFLYV